MKLRQVPEYYRRAIRLALAVGLPCVLGYGVLLPEKHVNSKYFAQACKWAAITAVVVTMPVIGKVSQVGAERTIGTIVGGSLGFVVYGVGSKVWNDATDGVVLSITASVVAFLGVVVGARLGLDLSARLFTITFLLVTFGAQEGKDPFRLAVTRVGGIVGGVLLMLLLSILVLPKSASVEALHSLEKALASLSQLNQLAWKNYLTPKEAGGPAGAQPGPATPKRLRSCGYESVPGEPAPGEGLARPVAASPAANGASGNGKAAAELEEYHEQCEKVLTDIYQALFKLAENVELGQSEILLASCWGRLIFIPGPPFVGLRSKHMPWADLGEVATEVRRVARLLTTLISTLDHGFERDMQAMLGDAYPERLLQQLAEAIQGAIEGMKASFPASVDCPAGCLAQLTVAVAELVQVSDRQRRSIVSALRRGKRRRFARQAWQRLIDTVRAAQAEEVEVTKQKSLRSTPDSTSPADVRQRLLGGAGEEAAAEEGRHSLRQLPSGTAPLSFRRPSADVTWPSGSSGGASFRQLEIPAPDADQLAAAAAQLQRDLVGGGSAASSRANSEAEGLGAILDEMQGGQPADSSSAAAAPAAGPLAASAQQAAQGGARTPSPPPRSAASTPSPEGWRSALRAISNEEIDQLAEDLERMESREGPPEPDLQRAALLGQARRVSFTGQGRSETLRLAMFPETTEGFVAQVRWYSFHFLVEELADELAELHSALCDTLRQLPR